MFTIRHILFERDTTETIESFPFFWKSQILQVTAVN